MINKLIAKKTSVVERRAEISLAHFEHGNNSLLLLQSREFVLFLFDDIRDV